MTPLTGDEGPRVTIIKTEFFKLSKEDQEREREIWRAVWLKALLQDHEAGLARHHGKET